MHSVEQADLLDVLTNAWNEASEHSLTIEQLLQEIEVQHDSMPDAVRRINEATRLYHVAMRRYEEASKGYKSVLAGSLN